MRTVVDHDAETCSEVQFFGEIGGNGEKMSRHGLVLRGEDGHSRDEFFGHDQQVNRRLRLNIVEDNALLILVFDPGWDLAINYLLEDRFAHGLP
jgi:hypothetical protein